MKPVFINFTNEKGEKTKTYTTCTLKTGTMDLIFDIAERAEELEKGKLGMRDVKNFYEDLKALILRVFNYQFSLEELNDGLEQTDLIKTFQELCNRVGTEMKKN